MERNGKDIFCELLDLGRLDVWLALRSPNLPEIPQAHILRPYVSELRLTPANHHKIRVDQQYRKLARKSETSLTRNLLPRTLTWTERARFSYLREPPNESFMFPLGQFSRSLT